MGMPQDTHLQFSHFLPDKEFRIVKGSYRNQALVHRVVNIEQPGVGNITTVDANATNFEHRTKTGAEMSATGRSEPLTYSDLVPVDHPSNPISRH